MANWRSRSETVHFFGPKWVIFGVLALQKEGETFEGFGRKMAYSSSCLDAPKVWVSIEIYSINRASKWLWLVTQEAPQNGQNVHGFQVRTPIRHIVPVSRAYPPPSGIFN